MGNVTDFEAGMKLLRSRMTDKADYQGHFHVTEEQDAKDAELMSSPDNWCCVRAIDIEPWYDEEGNVVLPSLGQLAGGEIERNTVHTTLNHVVESHKGGNWDGHLYVVFAPYNDVVARNGKPVGLDLVDTYFSTDVDTGLVIPKDSAYVVQPSSEPGGPLYTIGEHGATYKMDYFTEDEIQTILSMLQPAELKEYNRLMAGDLTDSEINVALGYARVKTWYEKSTNKKQFLIGLMHENRMVILTRFLRDAVVRLAMAKKGFQYIDDTVYRAVEEERGECKSQVEKAIQDVAIKEKIDTGSSRHANSFYGLNGFGVQGAAEMLRVEVNGIISENNMDDLFVKLYKFYHQENAQQRSLAEAVLYGRFIDNIYDEVYQPLFQHYKQDQQNKADADTTSKPQFIERYGYMYSGVQEFKTIEEFDPKLAKALKRQSSVLFDKLRKWRKSMENDPKFQKLLEKWRDFMDHNYTDIKEFLKPSIEQQFVQPQQMMRPREM